MGEKDITTRELIKVAERAYLQITGDLKDEKGETSPYEVMSALAITHRLVFAAIEATVGIEKAREYTDDLIKLIDITAREGAWDEENQKVK